MTGFFDGTDLTLNRIEQRRAARPDAIDLTSANPTRQGQRFPADVLAAAAAPYWESRVYTPDSRGLPSARAAIATYYATRTPALTLDPTTDIVVTASTSEAYALLFGLLANPGDNVLAPAVSYPLFEHLAALFHIELRSYPLDETRGWRIDGLSLARLADERTRAVLIVSPHNPTGAVVRAPIPALRLLDVPVVVDEVFASFPYSLAAVPPLAALMPDQAIFTLNGLSKMAALPDLKLGWIAMTASAQARYGERLAVLNDAFLGASGLVQTMLPAILAAGQPFMAAQAADIHANVTAALAVLATSPHLRVRAPDAGYYVFVEVTLAVDEETLVLYLLDAGVFVYPGYFFGQTTSRYLAISCLVAQPTLLAGIHILVDALAAYPT